METIGKGLAVPLLLATFSAHADISIDPPQPRAEDAVRITVSGEFGTPCFEVSSSHQVKGELVEIAVSLTRTSEMCAQVVTPWKVSEAVGSLAPGHYRVAVQVDAPCCFPCKSPPCSEQASFSVLDASPPGEQCGGLILFATFALVNRRMSPSYDSPGVRDG